MKISLRETSAAAMLLACAHISAYPSETAFERGLPRARGPAPLPSSGPPPTCPLGEGFTGPYVPSVRDSAATYSRWQVAVSPERCLYAHYRIIDSPDGPFRLALARSLDGGFEWSRLTLIDDIVGRAPIDMSTIATPHASGTAWSLRDSSFVQTVYFRALTADGSALDPSVPVVRGREVGEDLAVPRLVATADMIVCAWTHRSSTWRGGAASRSFDGGLTWSGIEIVDSTATSITWGGPFLAAAPDGHVYASIFSRSAELRVFRSGPTDATWELRGAPEDSTVDLSRGISVSSIAVAPNGTIGLVYESEETGNPNAWTEVQFATSADGGLTWSDPFEVSAAAREDRNHGEPKLVCDRFGTWHLAWITNAAPSFSLIDICYARRATGDTTWTQPVRVNREAGTVDPEAPTTIGLAVDADGEVYIAWGHAPSWNAENVYVATTRRVPHDPHAGVVFTVLPVSPNPFRSTTSLRIPVDERALIEVTLCDVLGRLVRSWDLGTLARGVHPLAWDGRDRRGVAMPAGVYFWQVERHVASRVERLRAQSVKTAR